MKIMTEFRVGRGHDGPARVGEYIMNDVTFETPILIGPESSRANPLHYKTLGRDPDRQRPMISAIPFTMAPDELSRIGLNDSDSILLPSMVSFSSLSDDASILLLRNQLDFIDAIKDTIDISRLIMRVPENICFDDFKSYLDDFHSKGIRAAAFSFDGLLGSVDFESIHLRSALPASWLSIALGKITPDIIPLLFYTGFDIIDSGYSIETAVTGIRLWRNDSEHIIPDKPHRFCSCIHCVSFSDDSNSKLLETLQNHNLDVFTEILSESINAMKNGKLRWLVESMTHVSPNHASLLRQVDKRTYSYVEEFTPTSGADVVPLIGPESYNSPVVRRYREFLDSRYTPPLGKKIVLLLPCSARKPYSDSKSHRRYLETIESALGKTVGNVAQVILTSPLGIVPRELERVFPAANYDIPVTGDWDTEETELGADALITYLNKIDSDSTVVAHVSGGYLGIVKAAESMVSQSIIYTTPDASAGSWESRQALHETLVDLRGLLQLKDRPPRQLEEIVRATADFQFGSGAGKILVPENAKLGGKPYRQIVCRIEKEQICSFIASSGSLSLTLSGAKLLAPLNRYWVRLDVSQVKGGSIFAVGINEADQEIRPGDEVIIINNDNEVIAVGKSEMSGREMCELSRGRAVSLRHKLEG
jgi:archaeosine synthase alpha-subunit